MIRRIAAATAATAILTAGLLGTGIQADAAPKPIKMGDKICVFTGPKPGCYTYR